MRELSPDAAALIRSGRAALRPDASAHARVRESLSRTLGDGAFVDGHAELLPKGAATARFFSRWGRALGGLSVLAVGAGIVVAAHPWTASSARLRPAPAVLLRPPVEPAASTTLAFSLDEPAPAPAPAPPPLSAGAPRSRPRSAPAPISDSLTEEVRLLARAERQSSDGSGEDALRTLGEHERRFPKGALAEERTAVRVEALCALGRLAEARTELVRLSRTYPRSAHLDGVQKFCGRDPGSAL